MMKTKPEFPKLWVIYNPDNILELIRYQCTLILKRCLLKKYLLLHMTHIIRIPVFSFGTNL